MRVTDPEAGALLADDRMRALILLFAAEPLTLAEAAAKGGMDLKRLHHHAGRCRSAGLLKVVGERRRPGRSMKLYQAAAESFFVLDEHLPAPFTLTLSDELRQGLVEQGFRAGRGMLFSKDEQGGSSVTRIEGGGPPDVIDLWVQARLTRHDLAALKAELLAVVRKFERPGARGSIPYLIHAAAAPRTKR